MRIPLTAAVVAFATLLVTASCEDTKAPAAPSASSLSRPDRLIASLRITGPTTIGAPGEVTQVAAIATLVDGTESDVTATALWSASDGLVFTVAGPGLFRALRYGTDLAGVSYAGKFVQAECRVVPSGAWLTSGRVVAASGVMLAGAAVEAASPAGRFGMKTDDLGWFVLPARGETVLSVAAPGFERLEKRLTAVADTRVDVTMARTPHEASISGRYELVITASTSCTLPAAAMERHCDAVVEEVPRGIIVQVPGDAMVAWGGQAGFTGAREGDMLNVTIRDTYDDGYNLVERIPGVGDLHFSGTASVRVTNGTIAGGPFQGQLKLRPSWGSGMSADCTASDHRIAFAK
jgi:hypothetical protein